LQGGQVHGIRPPTGADHADFDGHGNSLSSGQWLVKKCRVQSEEYREKIGRVEDGITFMAVACERPLMTGFCRTLRLAIKHTRGCP
jgi:hypothetical protein